MAQGQFCAANRGHHKAPRHRCRHQHQSRRHQLYRVSLREAGRTTDQGQAGATPHAGRALDIERQPVERHRQRCGNPLLGPPSDGHRHHGVHRLRYRVCHRHRRRTTPRSSRLGHPHCGISRYEPHRLLPSCHARGWHHRGRKQRHGRGGYESGGEDGVDRDWRYSRKRMHHQRNLFGNDFRARDCQARSDGVRCNRYLEFVVQCSFPRLKSICCIFICRRKVALRGHAHGSRWRWLPWRARRPVGRQS